MQSKEYFKSKEIKYAAKITSAEVELFKNPF